MIYQQKAYSSKGFKEMDYLREKIETDLLTLDFKDGLPYKYDLNHIVLQEVLYMLIAEAESMSRGTVQGDMYRDIIELKEKVQDLESIIS